MQMGPSYDYLIKVACFGKQKSGVSALICRISNDVYSEYGFLSDDFKIVNREMNGHKVCLQMWDVGESKMNKTAGHIRGSHTVMVCVDLSNEKGIEHAVDQIKEAKRILPEEFNVILVGTKADIDAERKISSEAFNSFAESQGYPCIEVSAKTGNNTEQLLGLVNQKFAERYPDRVSPAAPPTKERKSILSSFKQVFKKSDKSEKSQEAKGKAEKYKP
jgi:small GTP-binding protein